MKAMTYVIRFEENLNLGDIDLYLKEIESPIRLEIGDKIQLGLASFDREGNDDLDKDYIDELMGYLFEKSIDVLKYRAYFEISDIIYNHVHYYDCDDDEFNFHGIITLKGK